MNPLIRKHYLKIVQAVAFGAFSAGGFLAAAKIQANQDRQTMQDTSAKVAEVAQWVAGHREDIIRQGAHTDSQDAAIARIEKYIELNATEHAAIKACLGQLDVKVGILLDRTNPRTTAVAATP